MTKNLGGNAIQISTPFMEALGQNQSTDVQIMGGVGSLALASDMLVILPCEKVIIAQGEHYLPQYRPARRFGQETRGTLRDIDINVLSTDPQRVLEVEELARQSIADQLKISVFGLHKVSDLRDMANNGARSTAKSWLADRYMGDAFLYKAVYPFAARIDKETLETWSLQMNGLHIPIPNPATSVLNYLTRSISGLRPKDQKKVDKIAANIFTKAPELLDWVHDGPGKGLLEFASILHGLREPNYPHNLSVGGLLNVKAATRSVAEQASSVLMDELGNSPLSEKQKAAAVRIARIKSRGLHWAERHDGLVDGFQALIEPLLSEVVTNTKK